MKWQVDLIKDIRYGDYRDDIDSPWEMGVSQVEWPVPRPEFSQCNRKKLLESYLKIRQKCKTILEIGVHRNANESSTSVLLNNKMPETVYIGVDLEDKSYLNSKELNVHTIRTDSSNYDEVVSYIKGLGIQEIDFFFIDGWHSINQVYKDWEYTKLLSKDGIVGFHDTNMHPGPKAFIEALDSTKWEIEKYCLQDNGIGFVRRK